MEQAIYSMHALTSSRNAFDFHSIFWLTQLLIELHSWKIMCIVRHLWRFSMCVCVFAWNVFACVLDGYWAVFSRYCLPLLLILHFDYCCLLLRMWKPRSNTQMALQICALAHIINYTAISFRAMAKSLCFILCQKYLPYCLAVHTHKH